MTTNTHTDTVVGFAYVLRTHGYNDYELLERKTDGDLVSIGTYDSPALVLNVLDVLDGS